MTTRNYLTSLFVLIILASNISAISKYNLNQIGDRSVIVHLFEWPFFIIARECENWLGPKGFGAVQVSPVTEHIALPTHPWWERYQPISYEINTRLGNHVDFADMAMRCAAVGVRIYVDVVLNHMAADNPPPVIGTLLNIATPSIGDYPAVPYTEDDFHERCEITNWNDPHEMRNCDLSGLRDLDQSKEHVRERIVDLLNRLINLGAAGFKIDSAKHIWPKDLAAIYSEVKNLNETFAFPPDTTPFFYHEVHDYGSQMGDLGRWEYSNLGLVTEYLMPGEYGRVFRGVTPMKHIKNWGREWNFINPELAITFVDNYDIQRNLVRYGKSILTYKNPREYAMAVAFMLAHPYGTPVLMSSYEFNDNPDIGPPQDQAANIIPPLIYADESCGRGWICEHRWPGISSMVYFRNIAKDMVLKNWWDNDNKQISFSRGESAFVAFNGEKNDFDAYVPTGLKPGQYCDIVAGRFETEKNGNIYCYPGKSFTVHRDGNAHIFIDLTDSNGFIALVKNAALSYDCDSMPFGEFIKLFYGNFYCFAD